MAWNADNKIYFNTDVLKHAFPPISFVDTRTHEIFHIYVQHTSNFRSLWCHYLCKTMFRTVIFSSSPRGHQQSRVSAAVINVEPKLMYTLSYYLGACERWTYARVQAIGRVENGGQNSGQESWHFGRADHREEPVSSGNHHHSPYLSVQWTQLYDTETWPVYTILLRNNVN